MKCCLIHEMFGCVYAHLVLEVGLRDLYKSFHISYLQTKLKNFRSEITRVVCRTVFTGGRLYSLHLATRARSLKMPSLPKSNWFTGRTQVYVNLLDSKMLSRPSLITYFSYFNPSNYLYIKNLIRYITYIPLQNSCTLNLMQIFIASIIFLTTSKYHKKEICLGM